MSKESEHEEREQRLALLLAELTDKALRDEDVDIQSVCREHPDLAEDLMDLWGTVMVTDVAGSNASDTNKSKSSSER